MFNYQYCFHNILNKLFFLQSELLVRKCQIKLIPNEHGVCDILVRR
jgi:hypothetical protein